MLSPQNSHLCLAASAAVVSRMLTASLLLGGMSSVDAVQSGAGLEDTARHGFRAAVAVTAAEPRFSCWVRVGRVAPDFVQEN